MSDFNKNMTFKLLMMFDKILDYLDYKISEAGYVLLSKTLDMYKLAISDEVVALFDEFINQWTEVIYKGANYETEEVIMNFDALCNKIREYLVKED